MGTTFTFINITITQTVIWTSVHLDWSSPDERFCVERAWDVDVDTTRMRGAFPSLTEGDGAAVSIMSDEVRGENSTQST